MTVRKPNSPGNAGGIKSHVSNVLTLCCGLQPRTLRENSGWY